MVESNMGKTHLKWQNTDCKAIKQAKRQYRDQVESQFNGSDTRCVWQGIQTITDYKRKTNHVADTSILLIKSKCICHMHRIQQV